MLEGTIYFAYLLYDPFGKFGLFLEMKE